MDYRFDSLQVASSGSVRGSDGQSGSGLVADRQRELAAAWSRWRAMRHRQSAQPGRAEPEHAFITPALARDAPRSHFHFHCLLRRPQQHSSRRSSGSTAVAIASTKLACVIPSPP